MSKPSLAIYGPIAIDSIPSIPWKNGGGTTRTLAVYPEGADLNDFTWRLSLAEIRSSGGFSIFPGIDRTILLWSGDGVRLHSATWPTHSLEQLWEPFNFRGEEEVLCELVRGATTDLNLMVHRGRAAGTLRTHQAETTLSYPYDDIVILCARGSVRLLMAEEPGFILKAGHFLRFGNVGVEITICPDELNAVFLCASVQSLVTRRD